MKTSLGILKRDLLALAKNPIALLEDAVPLCGLLRKAAKGSWRKPATGSAHGRLVVAR